MSMQDTQEFQRRRRLAIQIEQDYRRRALVMMDARVQPQLILDFVVREERRIHRLLRKKDE